MNYPEAQRFIVFQISAKDMKLINSHPASGGSSLTLAFCEETNTWKLADETDNPLHRLFSSVKRLLQAEKRFEGSAGTLAQKLKNVDSTLDYAPNALTRIFNRHSISMEYEYGIRYQRKKRTSECVGIHVVPAKIAFFFSLWNDGYDGYDGYLGSGKTGRAVMKSERQ